LLKSGYSFSVSNDVDNGGQPFLQIEDVPD
jgi:hypothetical protein